jgi:4-hydroxy-3-methylbut-2-enyl diphosphate reductase
VHLEAIKFAKQGYTIILIGHRYHDEVIGTLGEVPESSVLVETVEDVERLQVPDGEKTCFLTQTTLSLDETKDIVEALRKKFPGIKSPPGQDICYATENRQLGVKAVVPQVDLLLVVGSRNSSNSMRLVEVCQQAGVPAYLVDDFTQVQDAWLEDVQSVAVTAGASAPEYLVDQLIAFLRDSRQFSQLEELTLKDEDVRFSLPAELATASQRLHTISTL